MRAAFAGALALALYGCAAVPAGGPSRPVTGLAALRATLDSIHASANFRSAVVGILVVDAETGETLYSRNAETALMPASNMKIVTGAVALARLGPDYRYRTTYELRGQVSDSVLNGDMLVFGRGDPSVSQRMLGNPLTALGGVADSLRARGIARVNGRLVHAGDAFPGSIYGFGWSHGYLGESYAAGVDELLFNEGLSFDPAHPHGGDTTSASTAGDPARAYLDALRFALSTRGVVISDSTIRDSAAVPVPGAPAFDVLSPPLSEILAALEKPSQNQMAEALFRTLALDSTGSGDPSTAAGIVTQQLIKWGADTMQFIIRDGSGLSRHNLVSPATVVAVLRAMRAHPHFAHFHAALPAVGREGTVRRWLPGTRASEVVRGKTGTLDMVRAFSGYATSADGRPIVFSFIANHYRTPTEAVTEAIQTMLRSLTELPLRQ
ncbi:MAG TPA: D-alanyl-D-alanine carboxypeptidase/D-alanyl-D-alanine-endopeptidase [Gemmatimonadaceae bacterium]